MKQTTFLIFIILISLGTLSDASGVTHIIKRSKLFDGTEYIFTSGRIGDPDIPRWSDKSKHPPLAPWVASEKAMEFMKDITPRENLEWSVSSISLTKARGGKSELWLYEILITEQAKSGYWIDGPAQKMRILVLMNGEIPEPTIKKKVTPKQVDPIVTTPVDEVEAQSTQGHP